MQNEKQNYMGSLCLWGQGRCRHKCYRLGKTGRSTWSWEILLTSMDNDGKKEGYDIDLVKSISEAVAIPVIASGGAGKLEDFRDVFIKGGANAALAASLFHYGLLRIRDVKEYLSDQGVEVKL